MRNALTRTIIQNSFSIFFTMVSLAILGFLAFQSSSKNPPSSSQAVLLAVFAGITQVLAGYAGARGAPSVFVKSALMRLHKVADMAKAADEIAQSARKGGSTATEKREALGQVSVLLSYIQSNALDAVQDWINLRPDATENKPEE
jgi:hypothetical protein